MQATARPILVVSADGKGVVSPAGSRLLADLADRSTLTGQVSAALAWLCRPRAAHDPGRGVAGPGFIVDRSGRGGAEPPQ